MSAFVVADQTINEPVATLRDLEYGETLRRIIKEETGFGFDDAGMTGLGAAMFALNCNAVEQRYGAGQAADFRALDYAFSFELSSSVQALKSLRCWLYQCSEGDVPETSLLYATMERVSGLWALLILNSLPEYEKARW